MGMKRGIFEAVSLSSSEARAVQHSTIRPDEGTPLRIGAKALDAWADAFGKMAEMSSRVKAVKSQNRATQDACWGAKKEALDALNEFDSNPANKNNKEQRAELQAAVDQASARYDASMTLGVFSNAFDMNQKRDWVEWKQKQK